MELKIRPLNMDMAEAFTQYLSGLDFGHAPHWSTCFCRYYYTDCDMDTWRGRSGEVNRAEALEEIQAGRMKGYLAFINDICVGWCSVNDLDRLIRMKQELGPFCEGKRTACICCFVIHPEYRGKGIARALLNQVIQDYRAAEYEGIIVAPFDNPSEPEKRYRGTWNMYLEAGFREFARDEDVRILWKDLLPI